MSLDDLEKLKRNNQELQEIINNSWDGIGIIDKTSKLIYINNAFDSLKYNENNENIIIELWFYRFAHYEEYINEAQEKLDKLLKKGYRSIGWDFTDNIERARKDKSKNILLLEEYAKKITIEGYYEKSL